MSERGEQIKRAKQVVAEHGQEMAVLYEAGRRLDDIAEQFGIGRSTVASAIRANGGTVRGRGFAGMVSGVVGANNPRWTGGSYVGTSGYRQVWVAPDDPMREMASSKGYVPEHRLVMARLIGRPLDRYTETVHHIDGDRLNNEATNLQLRNGRHGKGSHWRCRDCGSQNVGAVAI